MTGLTVMQYIFRRVMDHFLSILFAFENSEYCITREWKHFDVHTTKMGGQNEKTLYTMDGSNNSYCFLVFIFSME